MRKVLLLGPQRCRARPRPRKPHPVGPLLRGSTSRQADEKRRVKGRGKPLNWTGAWGVLVAVTGGRITFRKERQTTGDAMQYDTPNGGSLPSPSSRLASLLALLMLLSALGTRLLSREPPGAADVQHPSRADISRLFFPRVQSNTFIRLEWEISTRKT
ncbi:hypothetical protein NDU88_003090 [Pleurodeles waltl]|uniref:Uncharacterized protein n=1 Tax=Pleurodeles waltl TaxID=8319 RepID=A0AAV7M4D3_PLEWA|nr:hypothetical protein NDU88_003090 [Pleurodeles waltl]